MPNIATYEDKGGAPRADQAGSEAYEVEGRHIEGAYATAGNAIGGGLKSLGGEIQQHDEMQDTSANSVQGAAAFANLSNQLSQTAAAAGADPINSEKHFSDFQAQMESTIGAIGQDAATTQGKQNAERIQNTLREEFTRQTIGAQSAVSGQVVSNNLTLTSNNLAQAVSDNPTLLPAATAMLQGSLEDQLKAHNLSPEENTRIRTQYGAPAVKQLGVAAFQTMAQNNPDAAKDALTKGQFAGMFNGDEIGTLNRYADAQSKAQTVSQKAAAEQQKAADKDQFRATTSAMVGSFIQPDGTLAIPPNAPKQVIQMSLMPGSDPGEIRSLADMMKTVVADQEKGVKAVTDPETFAKFGPAMLNGTLSAQDVYNARNNGQLSDKDTSYFLSGMKNLQEDPTRKAAEKQFNDWAQAQKPAFTKGSGLLGIADPHGTEKFNQFQQAAHAQFEQAYTQKGDWQGLLNAKNPGYLGKSAPQYMQNTKGASLPPPPRFASDADVNAFLAKNKGKGNLPFIGPDGKQYYTKGQ